MMAPTAYSSGAASAMKLSDDEFNQSLREFAVAAANVINKDDHTDILPTVCTIRRSRSGELDLTIRVLFHDSEKEDSDEGSPGSDCVSTLQMIHDFGEHLARDGETLPLAAFVAAETVADSVLICGCTSDRRTNAATLPIKRNSSGILHANAPSYCCYNDGGPEISEERNPSVAFFNGMEAAADK